MKHVYPAILVLLVLALVAFGWLYFSRQAPSVGTRPAEAPPAQEPAPDLSKVEWVTTPKKRPSGDTPEAELQAIVTHPPQDYLFPEDKDRAVEIVRQVGVPKAVEAFDKAFKPDLPQENREMAAYVLCLAASTLRDRGAEDASVDRSAVLQRLLKALKDPNPAVRKQALAGLDNLGDQSRENLESRLLDALVSSADDKEDEVAFLASCYLVHLGKRDLVPQRMRSAVRDITF
jgi:hypothetical protein